MPLTDKDRKTLSDEIESDNEVKLFIALRIPSVSAVRLFKARLKTGLAEVMELQDDEVDEWTISYPLDETIHYRVRSRATWGEKNAPILGVIHAVDGLSDSVKLEVQKAIEILEVFPDDLAEIVAEILDIPAVSSMKLSPLDLQTGASLCIKLNYAFSGGGAPTCTASVCPHK